MKALGKLVPPHSDKRWSFQVVRVEEGMRNECVAAFHHPDVSPAEPFLQGDSGGWLMIEFWRGGREEAETAAKRLASILRLDLFEGDFTRAELGL